MPFPLRFSLIICLPKRHTNKMCSELLIRFVDLLALNKSGKANLCTRSAFLLLYTDIAVMPFEQRSLGDKSLK